MNMDFFSHPLFEVNGRDFIVLIQELENVKEVRSNLTLLIRVYRPDVILTWNPNERFEDYLHGVQHVDHRTAGAITLQWYSVYFLFFFRFFSFNTQSTYERMKKDVNECNE
jgi:hypothetical protein